MSVVLSCVCVCMTVTHFFSVRGALTVTTAAFFAAHPYVTVQRNPGRMVGEDGGQKLETRLSTTWTVTQATHGTRYAALCSWCSAVRRKEGRSHDVRLRGCTCVQCTG